MRKIVLLTFFMAAAASSAWGDPDRKQSVDPMLRRWLLFIGPNLSVAELIPDADQKTSRTIGTLMISYPERVIDERDSPPVELKDVVPVATVIRRTKPDKALTALINLRLEPDFHFSCREASLVSMKRIGYRWQVDWELNPNYGGFSGPPLEYRAVVTARGKVIAPDLYQFDTYFTFGQKQWLCSILKLKLPENYKKQKTLSQQEIEERGRAAFQELLKKVKVTPGTDPVQFEFQDCRAIELPLSVGADGKFQSMKAWGVNFKEIQGPDDKKTEDIFTVWVMEDGTVSELKIIPVNW
ncbi:hypothetical protein Enr10x_20300 [Gimesia panareensis]|uniref:Uncharacterized protein n=1 Tax=Gimesia panareensis TaxID=2527978 RepID=A0A517Q510_9PLAN|nr:hypothetical protein [Gimesia panareensis]QDT26720.1 hypothetical protein Enr10x_20300 [Gimesia panareensis]